MTGPRPFGEGPLSVVAAIIYTLLSVEFALLLASLPGLVGLFLLQPDISNIPLAAACAIPLGPALSAAVYAIHHRRRDLTELAPMRQFWRAWRLNLPAVLPVWLVGLVWLTIVTVGVAHFWAAGLPRWWLVLLTLIGVLAVLWLTNALLVTSLFEFRFPDTLRLAWELVVRQPVVMLGNAGVLAAAVLIGLFTVEGLVLVLGSVLVLVLVATSRPLIDHVRDEFTQ